MTSPPLLLGEYQRNLDERFRLSIPPEFVDAVTSGSSDCFLAKERPGALSLWSGHRWREKLSGGIELIRQKIHAGRMEGRVEEVQMLGRLLSTRHKEVQLGDRGRLLIPEGFREFLSVEPGGEVIVVGAALCVEIWRPAAWIGYLEQSMPEFRNLFDELSG